MLDADADLDWWVRGENSNQSGSTYRNEVYEVCCFLWKMKFRDLLHKSPDWVRVRWSTYGSRDFRKEKHEICFCLEQQVEQ